MGDIKPTRKGCTYIWKVLFYNVLILILGDWAGDCVNPLESILKHATSVLVNKLFIHPSTQEYLWSSYLHGRQWGQRKHTPTLNSWSLQSNGVLTRNALAIVTGSLSKGDSGLRCGGEVDGGLAIQVLIGQRKYLIVNTMKSF